MDPRDRLESQEVVELRENPENQEYQISCREKLVFQEIKVGKDCLDFQEPEGRLDRLVTRGRCARPVKLFSALRDLQVNQESQVKGGQEAWLAFQEPKVPKGSKVSQDHLVLRDPSVCPASRGPPGLLVTLESCRGWGRRERTGIWEMRDHQVSKGQTDVQVLQDRKVFWERKETLGLWGQKVTGARLGRLVPEDC